MLLRVLAVAVTLAAGAARADIDGVARGGLKTVNPSGIPFTLPDSAVFQGKKVSGCSGPACDALHAHRWATEAGVRLAVRPSMAPSALEGMSHLRAAGGPGPVLKHLSLAARANQDTGATGAKRASPSRSTGRSRPVRGDRQPGCAARIPYSARASACVSVSPCSIAFAAKSRARLVEVLVSAIAM